MDSEAKMTFGELKVGDKFIGFPLPGDNSGHGGYLGAHYLYEKVSGMIPSVNAKRLFANDWSTFPDSMPVIKIE